MNELQEKFLKYLVGFLSLPILFVYTYYFEGVYATSANRVGLGLSIYADNTHNFYISNLLVLTYVLIYNLYFLDLYNKGLTCNPKKSLLSFYSPFISNVIVFGYPLFAYGIKVEIEGVYPAIVFFSSIIAPTALVVYYIYEYLNIGRKSRFGYYAVSAPFVFVSLIAVIIGLTDAYSGSGTVGYTPLIGEYGEGWYYYTIFRSGLYKQVFYTIIFSCLTSLVVSLFYDNYDYLFFEVTLFRLLSLSLPILFNFLLSLIALYKVSLTSKEVYFVMYEGISTAFYFLFPILFFTFGILYFVYDFLGRYGD